MYAGLLSDNVTLVLRIAMFINDKKMFDFIYYSIKSKQYDNSNKLVVVKIKDETAGFAIEDFCRIKAKDKFIFGR